MMKQPQSKPKYYDLNYNIGVPFHFSLSSISQRLINSLYSPRDKCYTPFAYNQDEKYCERGGEREIKLSDTCASIKELWQRQKRRQEGRNLIPSVF